MPLPDPNTSTIAARAPVTDSLPAAGPASLSSMVDLLVQAGWANFLICRVHHVFHRS
jgi:hypothetical protein